MHCVIERANDKSKSTSNSKSDTNPDDKPDNTSYGKAKNSKDGKSAGSIMVVPWAAALAAFSLA